MAKVTILSSEEVRNLLCVPAPQVDLNFMLRDYMSSRQLLLLLYLLAKRVLYKTMVILSWTGSKNNGSCDNKKQTSDSCNFLNSLAILIRGNT